MIAAIVGAVLMAIGILGLADVLDVPNAWGIVLTLGGLMLILASPFRSRL